MNIEVLVDSESVAQRVASTLTDAAWEALAARGSFVMAVSGGLHESLLPRAAAYGLRGAEAALGTELRRAS